MPYLIFCGNRTSECYSVQINNLKRAKNLGKHLGSRWSGGKISASALEVSMFATRFRRTLYDSLTSSVKRFPVGVSRKFGEGDAGLGLVFVI
ncbi:hypothetical protein AVEN_29390-1 [Araneus ventricosus]|uniref:Uncharacterized protein n=1 Tax=Araneus ventricosus TaxID=182803 RepID=A0A4Y2QY06_ARAVE|nr:hypothetical protein AVEN_29390-1 [Araneus ventricosus]